MKESMEINDQEGIKQYSYKEEPKRKVVKKLDEQYGIGSKLLKKMGWKEGQGAGITGKGMAEPIQVKLRPRKRGLGYDFNERIEQRQLSSTAVNNNRLTSDTVVAEEYNDELSSDDNYDDKNADGSRTTLTMRSNIVTTTTTTQTAVLQNTISFLQETADRHSNEYDYKIRIEEEHAKHALQDSKRLGNKAEEILNQSKRLGDFFTMAKRTLIPNSSSEEINCSSTKQQHNNLLLLLPCGGEFSRIKETFPEEWSRYKISQVIPGLIKPSLKERLKEWDPFESIGQEIIGELLEWRKVMDPPQEFNCELKEARRRYTTTNDNMILNDEEIIGSDDNDDMEGNELNNSSRSKAEDKQIYNEIIQETVIYRLQQAFHGWDVKERNEQGLCLIKAWNSVIPGALMKQLLETSILPCLQHAISEWSPKQSSIHVWFHQWLPIFDIDSLKVLFPQIRHKIASSLHNWSFSESNFCAFSILLPWKGIWDTTKLNSLIARIVVPKLVEGIKGLEIEPNKQAMKPIEDFLMWKELVPEHMMVSLLYSHLLPKCSAALIRWLQTPSVKYDEVVEWYKEWKKIIPTSLRAQQLIIDQFSYWLELMDYYCIGGLKETPIAPPTEHQIQKMNKRRQRRQQERIEAESVNNNNDDEQTKGRNKPTTAVSNTNMDLREVLELFATTHNVLFKPTQRTHNGRVIHKFGSLSIIIDNHLIHLLEQQTKQWRVVQLQDLIQQIMV